MSEHANIANGDMPQPEIASNEGALDARSASRFAEAGEVDHAPRRSELPTPEELPAQQQAEERARVMGLAAQALPNEAS